MGTTTISQGYPSPLGTDPADLPLQLKQFAEAVDADFSTWDTRFTSVTKSRSFRAHMSADGSAFTNTNQFLTFNTVDFNTSGFTIDGNASNTGSTADIGWWFFGACVLFGIGTGTVTVNSYNRYWFDILYQDPITAVFSETTRYCDDVETNVGTGGFVNFSTIVYVPGPVTFSHLVRSTDASSQRIVKAGTSWYGTYLGKANR